MNKFDLVLKNLKRNKITSNFSLHKPVFDNKDIISLSETIKTSWVSTKGKKTFEFEKALQKYLSAKYSIATNSGTSALFLALKSLGVKSGDEVIMPNISFIAVPNAIIYNQAIPHLVDTIKDELNICPHKLEKYLIQTTKIINNKCINKKTGNKIAGLVCVHVFGHMCEMDKLRKICKKFKIFLVEDAAEALGSKYNNKNPGYYSDIATISFNGNKIITSGAGGAVMTNKKKLYKKVISLSTLSNKPNCLHQNFTGLGYNLRMPSLNAALGITQLKKINLQVLKKRKIYLNYKKLFEKEKFFYLLSENRKQKSNYWLQCIILRKTFAKNTIDLFQKFKKKNISVRMLWSTMNTIPYLKKCPKSKLKNSLEISKRVICIPSN